MKDQINFSPEPFQNNRFFLVILWLINVALLLFLAFTIVKWTQLHRTNRQAHQTIAEIQSEQQAYDLSMRRIKENIDDIDTDAYKKQIPQFYAIEAAFHSQWGSLLDDLSTLLGPDVRLVRLESEESLKPDITTMSMRLDGFSRNKDAELAFIRALQKHPAFDNVHFETEAYSQEDRDTVGFQIRFDYTAKEV